MNRNYIVLVVIAVGLAIGMLLMEPSNQTKEIEPFKLAIAYNDPSRFLTIDEITDRLIKKDPGLILIDVRTADQFKTFSIPGAINIPVDSLLSFSSLEIIKNPELDKVIFSNADALSDQAWIICTRLAMPKVFVLKGGVNNWFKSIVQVTEPSPTAPSEAFDNYSFRLAANQYFYGAPASSVSPGAENEKTVRPVQKNVETKRSVPAAASGGGC